MNLDEARAGIGRRVIYSPFAEPDFDDETGVIIRVSDRYAFVAYGGQQQAKATNPGDLRFADDGNAAGWEPRPVAPGGLPDQVWLPHSGVMITCCPVHEVKAGPRRTHEEVRQMAACPDCARETLAPPLEEDPDGN